MKTRLFVFLLAIGVLFALLRVHPSVDPAVSDVQSESPANPPEGLFDITYVLQSSTGFTLVEGTTMVLSFSDDSEAVLDSDVPEDVISVYFNADCNNFWGDFRITSTALESTDSYMMTEMGCERPLHEQEDWLAEFLMDGPRLSWSGDHLTLTGDTATLSLLNKKVADLERPLVGRQWTSSHYIDRGSLSWMSLEAYPTLSFSEEGALSIFDGCNLLEGRFALNGSGLTVTHMTPMTEHQCTDENVLSISAHFEKVFADGALTYSIDANVLRIERGENGVEGYTD
jgi:heat shock protein HslJ